jgi:hypothetical protein
MALDHSCSVEVINACQGVAPAYQFRMGDGRGLRHARCLAICICAGGANDGANGVVVSNSVSESFDVHRHNPFTTPVTICGDIECLAPTFGGENTLLEHGNSHFRCQHEVRATDDG